MLKRLVALIEDIQSSLPDSVRVILKLLVDTFTALEAQITVLDAEINQRSKSDPTARRLMTIPGVGPIASTAITALVPAAEGFPAGRDFRGLARTDAAAEIDRRQAKARCRFETRSEAGQMTASDHAPRQAIRFPLRRGGRPQMESRHSSSLSEVALLEP